VMSPLPSDGEDIDGPRSRSPSPRTSSPFGTGRLNTVPVSRLTHTLVQVRHFRRHSSYAQR
jgi:hypothetical protein